MNLIIVKVSAISTYTINNISKCICVLNLSLLTRKIHFETLPFHVRMTTIFYMSKHKCSVFNETFGLSKTDLYSKIFFNLCLKRIDKGSSWWAGKQTQSASCHCRTCIHWLWLRQEPTASPAVKTGAICKKCTVHK